ncbi:hypothetical protein JW992_13165 [candidate division KSB1 bacterium]|nr:hypothetical protein [candidate division KSB1 bacterium]
MLFGGNPDAIEIGDRRELFVDTLLSDTLLGEAQLRLHHPVRREIALLHNKPWEGNGCGYHTVWKEDSLYRMTYKAWHIKADGNTENSVVICYAESEDGLHWVKPELGLVEFNGSRRNNIILDRVPGYGCHDFSPFIDTNPDAVPEQRYKAVGFGRGMKTNLALFGFVSADGIHWRPIQDEGLIHEPSFAFDTQNIAFWSETEKQYVLYYRKTVDGIRSIARAVSEDFIHWEKQGLLDFQGRGPSHLEQFYTNQIRPYERAPHLLIGFPARYCDRGWLRAVDALPSPELRRERAQKNPRYGSAVTDALLISSQDGRSFYRWDEAFLRPGLRTRHNWAYGDNYIACHVVETESLFDDQPAELSLYATESYFTGDWSRLRRYTLRLDGFVSLYAPGTGGEWISKPLLFSGNRLELNFSTAASGDIRVELQDVNGQPIPGFSLDDCEPIFGDALSFTVFWKDDPDLGALQGKPVRLRLTLREADIFSFRFAASDKEESNPAF